MTGAASGRSLPSLGRAVLVAVVCITLATVPGGHAFGAPSASIASTTITGALQPDQVVAADNRLWLVEGDGEGPGGTCQIARVNPISLSSVSYGLPACGFNATSGDGAVFLETYTSDQADGTYQIHVERFDTRTHSAVVFATASAALCLCSEIAHTQLAFEDGWLWFYGTPVTGAPQEVLQLSPENGAVVRAFTNVPAIGGTEPVIAGAGPYVWLAGGAGTAVSFLRIDVSTGATHRFTLFKSDASMYSVLAEPDRVFFLYLAWKGPAGSPGPTDNYIGRMTIDATVVGRSPNEQFGGQLVSVGHDLLSPGPGERCASGVRVWRVDPSTLRSTPIARVPTVGDPCLASSDSVAVVGSSLFYLSSTTSESVLARITPH